MVFLVSLYQDFDDVEKLLLFSLGVFNKPIKNKLVLQKLLFLISNVFKDYKNVLEFQPHLFGPYSEEADNYIENLISLGLVKKESKGYALTNEGKKVYLNLKVKDELVDVVKDFKLFLNDLSSDELLAFIYVTYPGFVEESAKWNDIKKNRIDIAISLLKKGKVSFGKAAQIAGLDVSSFENVLKERRVKWR